MDEVDRSTIQSIYRRRVRRLLVGFKVFFRTEPPIEFDELVRASAAHKEKKAVGDISNGLSEIWLPERNPPHNHSLF